MLATCELVPARRLAVNFAKVPELLRQSYGKTLQRFQSARTSAGNVLLEGFRLVPRGPSGDHRRWRCVRSWTGRWRTPDHHTFLTFLSLAERLPSISIVARGSRRPR